jgi:signal transduction histidine kinase
MVGARNFRRDDGLGAWSPPDQTFGVPSLIYLRLREAVRLSAMILALSSQWVIGRGTRALERWGQLRVPHRLAVGACLLVLAGMTYVGFYVTEHIREHAIQRAAGGVALYMDSVVERHVQELATRSTLSENSLHALERLLSPASMHRPVVAFRVWKDDTIIFGNERQLIGRTFPLTPAREMATQGHLGVELDHPDRDDDEQIWALKLPILEVYAPVRERGTAHIIAVVETYEVAVDLNKEIWTEQLAAWMVIVAIAAIDIFLMFSLVSSGRRERQSFIDRIAELTRLNAESEQHRQRLSHASLQVSAMNERSLRNVGDELRDETAQHIALALLKFESLQELVSRANGAAAPMAQDSEADLEEMRTALNASLRHIRDVANNLLPSDIEDLSVLDTLTRAARHHERRTGVAVALESRGLPEQLPFPIKACLYRFALESLDGVPADTRARSRSLCAVYDRRKIVLEVIGGRASATADSLHTVSKSHSFAGLRDRIEAVGGKLRLASTPTGEFSLVAELNVPDIELAGG